MRDFINENNISFEQGSRNSTVVTLIGYAQFKRIEKTDLKVELSKEIKKDNFIDEEIDRLWEYCKKNKYKAYWKTAEAQERYSF